MEENKDKAQLCALSYISAGIDLSSQVVANQVFSTRMSLTSVFGMGTGGTSQPLTPTIKHRGKDPQN